MVEPAPIEDQLTPGERAQAEEVARRDARQKVVGALMDIRARASKQALDRINWPLALGEAVVRVYGQPSAAAHLEIFAAIHVLLDVGDNELLTLDEMADRLTARERLEVERANGLDAEDAKMLLTYLDEIPTGGLEELGTMNKLRALAGESR